MKSIKSLVWLQQSDFSWRHKRTSDASNGMDCVQRKASDKQQAADERLAAAGESGADAVAIMSSSSARLHSGNGSGKEPIQATRQGKENQNNLNMTTTSQQVEAHDKLCFECKKPLSKSRHLINIAGHAQRCWHPECFKCQICDHQLDQETSCHVYRDKIVCKDDYARLQRDQSIKCSRCRWPIGASDWVRKAGAYVYHLACFTCDICQRQLNTGEQFTIHTTTNDSSMGDGNNIRDDTENRNRSAQLTVRLLCRIHFTVEGPARNQRDPQPQPSRSRRNAPTTTGDHLEGDCNHTNTSLELSGCQRTDCLLVGVTHSDNRYERGAQQSTYLQLMAPNVGSAEAHSRLDDSDVAGDLHLTGGRQFLSPQVESGHSLHGEQLQLHRHSRDLMSHHNAIGTHQPSAHSAASSSSSISNESSGVGAGSGSGGGAGPLSSSAQSKSKRVRTTFTEDQLAYLQNQFQYDSNPDGQDLERIANITGLSKRVTQVWFQNSRARQKKYLIKRKPINPISAAASVAAAVGAAVNSTAITPTSTIISASTPTTTTTANSSGTTFHRSADISGSRRQDISTQPQHRANPQHASDVTESMLSSAASFDQMRRQQVQKKIWSNESDRSELSSSSSQRSNGDSIGEDEDDDDEDFNDDEEEDDGQDMDDDQGARSEATMGTNS